MLDFCQAIYLAVMVIKFIILAPVKMSLRNEIMNYLFIESIYMTQVQLILKKKIIELNFVLLTSKENPYLKFIQITL